MFKHVILLNAENQINEALNQVVKIITGIGGTAFTLAIMIIGLVIIFGSISAAKMRTIWIALISCIAGAFIFFSAYWFSGAISQISMSPDNNGTSTSIVQPVEEHYSGFFD